MNSLRPTPPSWPPTAPRYVHVLSIAGSDSGGGAGVQADLKTFAALGCYGMTAITAVTAQNTRGVSAVQGLPPALVAAQVEAVAGDIGLDAIKVGMLLSADIVQAVAASLRALARPVPVVLDPVMVATSGDRLMAPDAVAVLVRELFPLATVVTPNLDEAALLLGHPVTEAAQFEAAAQALRALGARAVLLKGGHLAGGTVTDLLADDQGLRAWQAPRIASRNLHGTGCTLSAAIAAHLGLGLALADAVAAARDYVRAAIAAGAAVRTGEGCGPLNHGHAPLAQRLRAGGR
ncbi:MAG: bifunctional hydroxymethylpyrimidine kinase/phosphomethylpyrimidine kinase [Burkholderiales bacterium]|nr:bifunctional hydroxymethylpyrimidine kinase/phosphomethylpyrimidine kinase [Burkholderiales bacterium]